LKVLIGKIELKETNMHDLDEAPESAADELDIAQTDALAPQLVPSRFPLLDSAGANPVGNSVRLVSIPREPS
jgi:hypothetical protein